MKIADYRAVAAIGLLVPLLTAEAFAAVYYNSNGKFTVEVLEASTIFANSCSFNGNATELYGQEVNGTTIDSTGTVYVEFRADPGYVFTDVYLSFGQTGWANTSFGPAGYTHTGGWSVPGGVYQGQGSFRGGFDGQEVNWDVLGDGGTFYYRNIYAGSGGSYAWRDFMDRDGKVLLSNVETFGVTLSSDIHQFSVASYSGYGTSLGFHPTTTAAPIPELSTTSFLIACAGAAWVLMRRKRSTETKSSAQNGA